MTCNDVPGRVEEWHNPGKTVSECTTDRKHRPYNRTTEHSTSDSLGNISWIQKAALQHVQNHIAQDSVYCASCGTSLLTYCGSEK